ncbi:MAG: ParB/RepB/Spo0J family partition protein [Clostridia bacterium]|nr:ParB/RepB/Spo0J family partition protein [Clostridia bacterium]
MKELQATIPTPTLNSIFSAKETEKTNEAEKVESKATHGKIGTLSTGIQNASTLNADIQSTDIQSAGIQNAGNQNAGIQRAGTQNKASQTPSKGTKNQRDSSKPSTIEHIDIEAIHPNPNQPRKEFSEPSILKLADSIRQHGIIQPLTVRKLGHYYELIAGERRLRAAKELNLPTVPCIVTEATDEASAQMAIIENLIREDLNIFEQAAAISTLIDTYSLTQEQVAEKLSNSQSYIANKLRLLRFSAEERSIILNNKLTERHARCLLRISDSETRANILNKIINEDLNVAQTEELVSSALNQAPKVPLSPLKQTRPYTDIPSFISALNRALDNAKAGNLSIKTRKIVGEEFTELTIILPNTQQNSK